MTSLNLLCVTLLALFTTVYSHGMLCTPRQRGAYRSTKCRNNLPFPKNPETDYCAHCLNGGTVMTVASNLPRSGWNVYDPINDSDTGRRAGLCGDAFGDNSHMIGGRYMPYRDTPIVAHWKTGAVVDFEVEIDTNHNGYFEFFLCNLDACKSKDISGKCMKNGHCQRLTRIPHPDCQNPSLKTHFECGPIDNRFPSRWYVPCRKTGHAGVHLVGGSRGTMRYALPKGMNCNHCVLQWYWATANSCAPGGFLDYFNLYNNPFGVTCDSDGGGRGAHMPGMESCGDRRVPEEFWSCADVKISPGGSQAKSVAAINGDDRDFSRVDTKNPAAPIVDKAPTVPMPKNKPVKKPAVTKGKPVNKGTCIDQNQACNGKTRCCGNQMVCAYTRKRGFVCKLWYTLWKEAMDRS